METRTIPIEQYSYSLPDIRIAKYPLADREQSKLLIYQNGCIADSTFEQIADILPENSLLVRNNTKVIRARLFFRKETGGLIEIFCLEPFHPASYEQSLDATQTCTWYCLVGNRRKWDYLPLIRQIDRADSPPLRLQAEYMREAHAHGHIIRLSWDDPSLCFAQVLELCGQLPIPPYLHRQTEASDLESYQTVYAASEGSVAAPTAGLHFTPPVFDRLVAKGIPVHDVTLHVGAGTFLPVKSILLGEHHMHGEVATVSLRTIEELRDTARHIIAVGTTSVRTLESLYYIGLHLLDRPRDHDAMQQVEQWEPYTERSHWPTGREALDAVAQSIREQAKEEITFRTNILIAPGYTYRIVEGMITNFHQPRSTLLLLIAAFVGEDWRKIYDYAMEHDFRFLSYGDSSLLLGSTIGSEKAPNKD